MKSAWQHDLLTAVTDLPELCDLLDLSMDQLELLVDKQAKFSLKVPREFVDRMEKGNLYDPLLQQILPLNKENDLVIGYSTDPLQETKYNPVPGLIHKYHGRILLTLTRACAINCRYCFRRHFPYADNNPGDAWDEIFSYIGANPSIYEVILSGGDPLLNSDAQLNKFSRRLNDFPQITRLRIHSRIPIVLPSRISEDFISWINSLQQTPIIVLHCNHPNEINLLVSDALKKLKTTGVLLLNQSVLLRGINDNYIVLNQLSEKLFSNGVQPYYLHFLDKVHGAAHFAVPLERAIDIHRELANFLPGYLVPKLVCDNPGFLAKTVIA